MDHKGLQEIASLIDRHPDLQKAALSGLSKAVEDHIKNQNLSVSADAIKSLGQLAVGGGGNPVADDYVARGVSSVIAVVKVGVLDVANDLVQLHEIQSRLNQKVGANFGIKLPTIGS